MTPDVAWVESDPVQDYRGGTPGKYQDFFDTLRTRPGTWALFPREFTSSNIRSSTAANIRNGRYKGAPAGQFEARSFDGLLHVRYLNGDTA